MTFRGQVLSGRMLLLAVLCVSAMPALAPGQPNEQFPKPYPRHLEHRPTPIPDRIILTWANDPARSQAVTWRTDTSIESALAQLALAEADPQFVKKAETFPAATTPLRTDLGTAHYHSINFQGLTPGTKYAYRVGDGVNWSAWSHFRTASDQPEPFSFIYFGDAQNDIKSLWSRVVREAQSEAPKARFIVHAGDLVNQSDSDGEWGEWFQAAAWVNAAVPSVPTPGNHEYGIREPQGNKEQLTRHWRAQFTLPDHGPPGLEETVYYHDYQGVRIVSLNSNEDLGRQADWLEMVLADNPQRWTVVTFHHPVYSTSFRDNAELRQLWQPVFDRFRVDLVLQGHDHAYGRSGPIAAEKVSAGMSRRDPRSGTVYVVSVSGPKMYSLSRQDWMRRSGQNVQLYQVISVDGDRLDYQARTATGELYDAFELRKRPDQVNELLEKGPSDPEAEKAGQGARNAVIAALLAVAIAGLLWILRAVRRSLRRRQEEEPPL